MYTKWKEKFKKSITSSTRWQKSGLSVRFLCSQYICDNLEFSEVTNLEYKTRLLSALPSSSSDFSSLICIYVSLWHSRAEVGNPSWVWYRGELGCFLGVCLPVCVPSRCSGFLPLAKHVLVPLTRFSKLPVDASLWLLMSVWQLVQVVTCLHPMMQG